MYNSPRFRSQSVEEAFDLIHHYPFATMISNVGGELLITHCPLTPQLHDGQLELIGHMARANTHSHHLAHAPTTVVFQGAHTYITPQWYGENDVPTWNYSVLHATGSISLIEDEEGLLNCLRTLTAHSEQHWPSGWEFFVPKDLQGLQLTRAIVGFKLTVKAFDFKRKLSQNREADDRERVMQGLATRTDEASRRVLEDMRRLYRVSTNPRSNYD